MHSNGYLIGKRRSEKCASEKNNSVKMTCSRSKPMKSLMRRSSSCFAK